MRSATKPAVLATRPARLALILIVSLTLLAATGIAARPAAAQAGARTAAVAVCTSARHPRIAASMSAGIEHALAGRSSVAGLTADDPAAGITCRLHQNWHFYSASIVKVIILGALLHWLMTEHRGLSPGQVALTGAMITQSSNAAATTLWNELGMGRLQLFLNLAGMRQTELSYAWGLTLATAHDELLLLRLLVTKNRVLDASSRAYALRLMAEVIPSQRWGVPAGAASGVTVHVKNGWLPYPDAGDWRINSIGDFTGHDIGYSIAMLTTGNPNMEYGIVTIQEVAGVINRYLSRI
ncbi:MAG: serine hydrolase [Streptosporangiaceae bacterium]